MTTTSICIFCFFILYFFLLTIKITIPPASNRIGRIMVTSSPRSAACNAFTVRLLSVYSFSGITLPADWYP